MVQRVAATLLALILAIGVGGIAVAQSDSEARPDLGLPLFAVVMDPAADGSGVFTPFAEFREGGTVEFVEELSEAGMIGGVMRLDPAPPGGDTFDVATTGTEPARAASGMWQMVGLTWEIESGAGVFEDLGGGGEVVAALDPSVAAGTGFYFGSVRRAASGSDVARQNWEEILARFPDSKAVAKRVNRSSKMGPRQKGQLKKLQKENRRDLVFLDEIGSHPCYSDATYFLRGMIELLDDGLALKVKSDPNGDSLITGARAWEGGYESAILRVQC